MKEYISTIINDIPIEDILNELEDNKINLYLKNKNVTPKIIDNPLEFKRYLCDIFQLGYYVSNDKLLDLIKSKI